MICNLLKYNKKNMEEKENKTCANCLLCIYTHLGGECSLTNNLVDYEQESCIDYLPEEE